MTNPVSRAARCVVGGTAVAIDLAAVRGVDRGRVAADTPEYDLAELLGTAATTADDVLLLDTAGGPVALRVESVSRGFPLAAADLLAMPAAVGDTAFPAVARTPAGLLPWLDPLSLFAGRTADVTRPAPWRHRPAGGGLLSVPLPSAGRPWAAAFPAAAVAELFEPDAIAAVPGAADGVAGVVLWRGRAVAVIDLAARLGFAAPAGRPLVAVTATGAAEPVGFRVPRGARLVPTAVPSRAAERAFPGRADAVRACVETDAATLALIDLAAV